MTKVLITGGTGFVGQWMHRTQPPDLDCHYLSHTMYLIEPWEEWHWDYIVHLAPVSPYDAVKAANFSHARLLYCSSGIVYYPEGESEYRQKKMNWEKYCLDSGVNVVIARLFTFFGKYLDDNKAITQFFKAARAGKPLKLHQRGAVIRSYMHGGEMGRQMWLILFNGADGNAYDVGSSRPVTLLRVAQRIRAFTGCEIELLDIPAPVPVYYPRGKNGIMD